MKESKLRESKAVNPYDRLDKNRALCLACSLGDLDKVNELLTIRGASPTFRWNMPPGLEFQHITPIMAVILRNNKIDQDLKPKSQKDRREIIQLLADYGANLHDTTTHYPSSRGIAALTMCEDNHLKQALRQALDKNNDDYSMSPRHDGLKSGYRQKAGQLQI